MTITSITTAKNNAQLIGMCAELGYLSDEGHTLDPTWGYGAFWRGWRPASLVGTDLDHHKSPDGVSHDFTAMTWADATYDSVVFDPPYKLNGTDQGEGERYGVHVRAGWEARHQLIRAGITECHRVLKPGGTLLVKCQDQVGGNKKRWQTMEFAGHAVTLGMRLVDQLHLLSYRPQPHGRRQLHSHQNYSTMLVLRNPIVGGGPSRCVDQVAGPGSNSEGPTAPPFKGERRPPDGAAC